MDGGNWEFVFVDGSDGQVITLGLETGIIGNPGQSEALAFGGDPVRGSLVGVSLDITVGFFAVRVVGDSLESLLGVSFIASSAIRSSVAEIEKCELYFISKKKRDLNNVLLHTSTGRFRPSCGHPIG
jgi:hypothetical protein